MSLFQYNLNKYGKPIVIEDRDNKIINGAPQEVFSNPVDAVGIVCTLTGVTVFDSTNIETVATHKITADYIASVTAEQWILFKGKRIRILTVENCCEEDQIMILMCTERGDSSRVVNSA